MDGELAKRGFVTSHLVQNRGFGTPVGQEIDEIEDARPDAVRRQEASEAALEIVGLGRGRDFLVSDGNTLTELAQMRLEELALVGVERFVLTLAPPIRKARRDLAREESAEQRVS